MKCILCKEDAVHNDYCKEHFSEHFEEKVLSTIERFRLIDKKDRVAVAASGGKDSTTVLYILKKYGYDITALAINEGIKDYRDNSLDMLKKFCEQYKIPLRVVSFKEQLGKSLDKMILETGDRPCTVCGIFRRRFLGEYSKDYDALVTGHNMDDEAQAVIMNLVKGNTAAMKRQGPVAGSARIKGFTKRVKPLYLCSERDVMFYSSANKLIIDFNCCPNIGRSFRLRIKRSLNIMERKQPGTKERIIEWFLNYKGDMGEKEITLRECRKCGLPSAGEICNACAYKVKIKCL